jgi:succinate dehydrogenase hydrophobic anchor subunit
MSLKYLFSPEKSTKMVKLFHQSGYVLLPLAGCSYCISDELSVFSSILYTTTLMNFSFHSYVSTSFVISDYIKKPTLQNVFRVVNVKSHFLATLGYIYYFSKKYRE